MPKTRRGKLPGVGKPDRETGFERGLLAFFWTISFNI